MSKIAAFFQEVAGNIARLKGAASLRERSLEWMKAAGAFNYSYNFTWMGRPIIQVPQDIVAMQEILWRVRPDLVIETGVAHGGSLVFYASMLELLGGNRRVLGIDVDIRAHNREAIEAHPMARRIDLLQGSSVEPGLVASVHDRARAFSNVLVVLDSNHTHDHVLAELRAYAPLVTKGSYLVVFDTLVEDLPKETFASRPWGPGNSPKSAVNAFLKESDRFVVDDDVDAKLQISVSPGGYLRCVK